MIEIPSKLEGKHFSLYRLEEELKPRGYTIGSNWEYDDGYFDYLIDDRVGYQFLRIPFTSIDGQLDSLGATVEIGRPLLLSHKYQRGLDEEADTGLLSGMTNQFQEPVDKDASFPEEYIDLGKSLVQELEDLFL